MISIIIPTWNEGKNIRELAERLHKTIGSSKYELLIVDNNSTDEIKAVCDRLARRQVPIKLFQQSLDLANAVLFGFSQAKGETLIVMDGDLSHPPEIIPELISVFNAQGCDLIVGTRRKNGGRVEQWPLHRKIISRAGELIAKPLTRGCSDPMSGFFALKRSVIDGVELQPLGYKILLEILARGKINNIGEVPYVFRNRERGTSKLNAKEYVRYLRHLMSLYRYALCKIICFYN